MEENPDLSVAIPLRDIVPVEGLLGRCVPVSIVAVTLA